LNGVVTTATVRIRALFAISATTGAAPVPVPPPMPAVMNNMSRPSRLFAISTRLSSAASRPTSGSAPAPNPLVLFGPSCIFASTPDLSRSCTSVFAAMTRTPLKMSFSDASRACIMRLTALPPAPPMPMTPIFTS